MNKEKEAKIWGIKFDIVIAQLEILNIMRNLDPGDERFEKLNAQFEKLQEVIDKLS